MPNPYSWTNLSNVVWVEQPAGTGFSKKRGTPAATNEIEVADQFLGFWKNFVDTFGLHNRKVYITGKIHDGEIFGNKSDSRRRRIVRRSLCSLYCGCHAQQDR